MNAIRTADKNRLVKEVTRKGYPGIHKLRASCVHPLRARLAYALGITEAEVAERWQLLPPRGFWPRVREYAAEAGLSNAEAFLALVEMPVNPTSEPPHPLVWAR